ncbi:MAG: ABC transporter transmembrane domain-containing protein, partial [Bdellovibrionota bacterium]|nr:ABC transporter transmembrane domain-containing protein [Bdellovibrionota bacterium]
MKHPLKVFFSLENRGRGKILIAGLYSFLNKLSDLAPPVLIGTAVDIVIKKESSFLGKFVGGGVMKQLWALGGLTIFVWLLESIFEYLQKIRWRGLAQEIQHNFRMEGYNHLQKLDIGFFEYRSTGSLISLLNDDVNQFERFLNGGANDIVQVLTTVVIIGGGFFYMAPDVALFSFLPIPLILLFSFKFKDKVAPHYKKVREEV